MRKHTAVLVLMLALAGIAAGAATADPSGAKNSAPVTIVCDGTTYQAVANGSGAWSPAHDLNSNKILIPLTFGVETDVFTPAGGGAPEITFSPARAKGSANPSGQPTINCTYTVGPFVFPEGTFEALGTVTGFVTPG
jgi:hypothetical protein